MAFKERLLAFIEKVNHLRAEVGTNERINHEFPNMSVAVEEIFGLAPNKNCELMKWLDRVEHSIGDEAELLQEFDQFDPETKNLTKLMLDFVVKNGELNYATDLSNRQHWYELIKDR